MDLGSCNLKNKLHI